MAINSSDDTVRQLADVLWRASKEAQVVSSNIANVDTPGYRALRVEFQDTLKQLGSPELTRTDSRHFGGGTTGSAQVFVREAPSDRLRIDENSVDMDAEMSRWAMLHGRWNAATKLIRKRFALFQYAITDGR